MGGYLYNRLFYIFIYFVREHMSDRRSDRLPLSGLRPHQGGIFGPHSGLSRRMGDAALYLPHHTVACGSICTEVRLSQGTSLWMDEVGGYSPHLWNDRLLCHIHVQIFS